MNMQSEAVPSHTLSDYRLGGFIVHVINLPLKIVPSEHVLGGLRANHCSGPEWSGVPARLVSTGAPPCRRVEVSGLSLPEASWIATSWGSKGREFRSIPGQDQCAERRIPEASRDEMPKGLPCSIPPLPPIFASATSIRSGEASRITSSGKLGERNFRGFPWSRLPEGESPRGLLRRSLAPLPSAAPPLPNHRQPDDMYSSFRRVIAFCFLARH